MREFLVEIAIFVGLFWRSFSKTTFRAIALACFIIIGFGIVGDIFLWILFYDLVTKEIALAFLAFQIIAFMVASFVWFMILSGRGILVASIILFLVFLGGLSFPILEIKIAGLLATVILLILLFFAQKDEIEIFLFGAYERLKKKNEIIKRWSSSALVQQCDILLLTASAGSGHMVAARNIAEELERMMPDKKIACINVFDYLSSGLRNLQESYWEYLATYTPSFYRLIHRFILWNFKRLVQERAKIVARLIQKELKKSPLAIVTVHPMSTAVGSALKKITGSRLVVVPTDYYIHGHYTAHNVDLYCLPSNECFFVGIKKEDILLNSVVTGIPISLDSKTKKQEARRKLGIFDDAPIIFVNFGGIGIMRPKIRLELISLIIFCDIPCHFLLSDITNETLGNIVKFSKHFSKASCCVVNNSQLALSASDVMIGKVGGISISEAIRYGVPIGIWTHAGPEDFNAKFLMMKNLGVKIGGFWDFILDFPKTKKWISKPTI